MIPKIVKARGGKGSGGSGFKGLIEYVSTKADCVETRGIADDRRAASEMRAVASGNERVKKPVYHLVLSWAELERPTNSQMVEAADHALQKLGLTEHQAVLAIHRDRDHHHVHLVVNRVGPNGRAAELKHDFRKVEEACREIEKRQGWAQDRGGWELIEDGAGDVRLGKKAPRDAEAPRPEPSWSVDRERSTGKVSLVEVIRDQAGRLVVEIAAAKDWAEAHEAFGRLGLRYERKGSGAVLRNCIDISDVALPSHIDKRLSINALVKRLGPFVPAQESAKNRRTEAIDPRQVIPALASQTPLEARPRPIVAECRPIEPMPSRQVEVWLIVVRRQASPWIARAIDHTDGRTVVMKDGGKVTDHGDRITLEGPLSPQAIALMVAEGKAKGWPSIVFTGDDDFKRRAAVEAVKQGVEVANPELQEIVAQAKADLARQRAEAAFKAEQQRAAADAARRQQERAPVTDRHRQERDRLGRDQDARRDRWGRELRATGLANIAAELADKPEREAMRQRQRDERRRIQKDAVPAPEFRGFLIDQRQRGDQDAAEVLINLKTRRATATELADELAAMRRLDLASLAESMGYERDLKESTRDSIKLRRGAEVIIAKHERDGTWAYFNTGDDRDNGGVIQFVQRREGGTLGQVRHRLRPLLANADQAPAPTATAINRREIERDHTAARQAWMRAIENIPIYLKTRGIDAATIKRFADHIRADQRGNVLFAHRDTAGNVVGFEIKGSSYAGFAEGGQKALGRFGPTNAKRVVIVESGIDALSLAQIEARSDTLYVSTGGAIGRRTADELAALAQGRQVIIGIDADAAGDTQANRIQAAISRRASTIERKRPTGDRKDWNDELRHLAEQNHLQAERAEADRLAAEAAKPAPVIDRPDPEPSRPRSRGHSR